MNTLFAAIIFKALERKEISNSKLVQRFLEDHPAQSHENVKLSSIEPTDEIKSFCESFISKKMKCNNSVLLAYIQKNSSGIIKESAEPIKIKGVTRIKGEY